MSALRNDAVPLDAITQDVTPLPTDYRIYSISALQTQKLIVPSLHVSEVELKGINGKKA